MVGAHYSKIYRVCFRVTGDEELSWDLTQEALLTAYKRRRLDRKSVV